ncbi:CatB-related O-acetyltransferase [Lysobacter sp. P5_B9]
MSRYDLMRILLLPFGLASRVLDLAIDGSRDLQNKWRFKGAVVGPGACVDKQSRLETDTRILDGALILNSTVSSYTYVGRRSHVQNAKIGSFCSVANDVVIGPGVHPVERFSTSPLFYKKRNTFRIELVSSDTYGDEYRPVKIGNDVWIGARAIVMGGVAIGHGAVVAANSVVTKDVPPYAIVGGVPARVIRYRFSEAKIQRLLELRWWDWTLGEIQSKRVELDAL